MDNNAILTLSDELLERYRSSIPRKAFELDGPEPLRRHLGLPEADTYITKHDIDDLVTVVHITREEAPAWQR